MKVLVFGDIHGNLIALEKLFEIEKGNFDSFVCHGDIVNYGPWTNECLEFLSQLNNGIFLRGNHEEYYIEKLYPGENEIARAFFEFCYPKFNENYSPFIHGFQKSYIVEDFKIMHSINGLYIFKDTDISNLVFINNTIVGHSHQQFHRTVNKKNIYNTGSLGQNRATINVANYIIIDTKKKEVMLKNFVFDIEKIISKMEQMQYPSICLNYYKSKTRK